MKQLLFSALMLLSLSTAMAGCAQVVPNGEETTATTDLTGFDRIALAISTDVYVTQGEHSAKVTGPDEAVAKVELKVKDGTLYIGLKSKMRNWRGKGVKVYVSLPNLTGITVSGSGNVEIEDAFNEMQDLKLTVSGSGNISLAGSAQSVEVNVAGSGDVKAPDLNAETAKVRVAGSGDVRLGAIGQLTASVAGSGDVRVGQTEQIDVSIAGSGDVHYQGSPTIKQSIKGSGSVRSY